MQFLILEIHRTNLAEEFPSIIATSGYSLTNDDPRIIMTEDSGILLISSRIRTYLAHLHMICGVSRIIEHHTVFAVEILLARVDCLVHHSFLQTDASHSAEAL